jgi:hypothetical protein
VSAENEKGRQRLEFDTVTQMMKRHGLHAVVRGHQDMYNLQLLVKELPKNVDCVIQKKNPKP